MASRFVDEVTLEVASGHGGAGCVAFRREKCVEFGGPNGGNGGRGGDVVLVADPQLATLLDYRFMPRQLAGDGRAGGGNLCSGAAGAERQVPVPVGTLAYDLADGRLLADLCRGGQRHLLAAGGRGGRGNAHFKTARRQAPRFAQPGEPGRSLAIRLELRLLADVGLVGLPNVGKSSTIAQISASRPKIADYPFTTLVPNLGVVHRGIGRHIVVADVPGLIAGAHRGLGLGSRFLRHLRRVRCLVHVLTAPAEQASGELGAAPWADYQTIEAELAAHSPEFAGLPRVLLLNRCDLPAVRRHLPALMARARARGLMLFATSAATGEGMAAWLAHLEAQLAGQRAAEARAQAAVAGDPEGDLTADAAIAAIAVGR